MMLLECTRPSLVKMTMAIWVSIGAHTTSQLWIAEAVECSPSLNMIYGSGPKASCLCHLKVGPQKLKGAEISCIFNVIELKASLGKCI